MDGSLAPAEALTTAEILNLLKTPAAERRALYERADAVRKANMGDEVYFRGIVEFSNVCANSCLYCGIRVENKAVNRYHIEPEEVMEVARHMAGWAQTTIVLQSGEAPSVNGDRALGELIRRIKDETPLAVTISAGNRPIETYAYWRECGMDRYLLRFETSDPETFAYLHPDCTLEERLGCLRALRSLGVQVGSGFMIGVPGETLERLAANIELCRDLDLDMIGIGPFIPHPDTPLGNTRNAYADDPDLYFVAVSVLRLANPDAHLPATTAFDAVFPGRGRNLALKRGANVFMPNSTPGRYRGDYLLYPNKPCVDETSDQCAACVVGRVRGIGRKVGMGPGHSRKPRHQPQSERG